MTNDLIEKVARAIEAYKWDGKSDPDSWKGEARAAIAVVLREVWSKVNSLGGTNPLNDEAVHWEGKGIEKSLNEIEQVARENGIEL